MSNGECEMMRLCKAAHKRKEQMVNETPLLSVGMKIETDSALDKEYVVITMKEGGEERGVEFIENDSTFFTEAKARRHVDILKKGLCLGIVVPERSFDLVLGLKSMLRNQELRNPAFFVYDEAGNVKTV
ncbi:MAG: hypothetical protein LUQ14_00895 [Methanomassiliicoccales archaeon]|nr:hypothetical protein [Methanomassiliicoccales archaeon]